MSSVLLYDMLYHPIRARQTHFRFGGSAGDSFLATTSKSFFGCDLATNASNGQLISDRRQDCGYRSRCLLNDVDNIADKHEEQLQQLIVVNVRATSVVCCWIVMVRLHEHHPFCPRAVV